METEIFNSTTYCELPMIPLRGLIAFPLNTLHFDAGREISIKALEAAVASKSDLFLVPQEDADVSNPTIKDLAPVGTVCKIKQIVKLPNQNVRVLVEGLCRSELVDFKVQDGYLLADTRPVQIVDIEAREFDAYSHRILKAIEELKELDFKFPENMEELLTLQNVENFVDRITEVLPRIFKDRLYLLKECSQEHRLCFLLGTLQEEIELRKVDRKIAARVKKSIEQNQKEFYLREQMKAISEELGDGSEEAEEYRKKIEALKLDSALTDKLLKEVGRMTRMSPQSPESSVIRTYLDWVLELPWNVLSPDDEDLKRAAEILDEDHFGLEKVKERIVEYLAVNQMTKSMKGPILCFVGPPGVGKTSIAKSIARALNRKFVRMSLGGVKDEAEIRGHRKTYIGAIPGRILYYMKQAGTRNPVFLLDEIDKMGADYRGDPASAMLEVLDPEQNWAFRDHYLEIPFDLSKVMFLCTANTVDTIPAPLLDRMEIIQLTGYTEDEKVEIARKYLISKQEKEHGLTAGTLNLPDETLRGIISMYTRESGVRELERKIAAICRKCVKRLVENHEDCREIEIRPEELSSYLGSSTYLEDELSSMDEVGSVTGLAWTSAGGTTLTIEVSLIPGKGEIVLTGKLGDVMKESARTALSLVRSKAADYKIDPKIFSENDIHIHVPEGAVPKDGPSAGITIATAILSAVTNTPVNHLIAMTGEVTLRGKVLAIGGLKEKALAAHRLGIKKIIIPQQNKKDVAELPEKIKQDMELILTDNINTVFENSLVR